MLRADFEQTGPLKGTTELLISFTYTGSPEATEHIWQRDSGSGWTTFSTICEPKDVPFSLGLWSVRLLVKSPTDSDTRTKPDLIHVTPRRALTLSH